MRTIKYDALLVGGYCKENVIGIKPLWLQGLGTLSNVGMKNESRSGLKVSFLCRACVNYIIFQNPHNHPIMGNKNYQFPRELREAFAGFLAGIASVCDCSVAQMLVLINVSDPSCPPFRCDQNAATRYNISATPLQGTNSEK